ncbi:MAG: hypothetical protein ACR2MQ_07545 [Gemmatimonadaceae bacterium]
MPPKSLSTVAAELVHAADADSALATVHQELAAPDKSTGFTLLTYDARREALVNRALLSEDTPGSAAASPDHAHVALDHLPPPVRYSLLTGQRFVDVGDQAAEYARLLGVELPGRELRLLLKGIVVEGALVAVTAAYDARRRSAAKLLERAEPLAGLFELAYVRLYERDARFEAVAALHDVTSRLRAEHASSVGALGRELERLRAAQLAGTTEVVRQLRESLALAERQTAAAAQRLVAVEGQVVSAVERLERLHIQLAAQDATIRAQRETIRELNQASATSDSAAAR